MRVSDTTGERYPRATFSASASGRAVGVSPRPDAASPVAIRAASGVLPPRPDTAAGVRWWITALLDLGRPPAPVICADGGEYTPSPWQSPWASSCCGGLISRWRDHFPYAG